MPTTSSTKNAHRRVWHPAIPTHPSTHPSTHLPHTFFPTPSAYFTIRIGRRRHPHRSTQTSVTVDADIRNGRRRHPHRSTRMPQPTI
ncbi:hypothetical protein [Leyella stercorea]|uniref:hypothetical protein n=1 Tax=Leyella stercorea TaxID=363265 RepID=UPI003A91BC31